LRSANAVAPGRIGVLRIFALSEWHTSSKGPGELRVPVPDHEADPIEPLPTASNGPAG
jgi:hypothetical protein